MFSSCTPAGRRSSAQGLSHSFLAVTATIDENRSTEDEVVATLLHNVPEDRGSKARLKDSDTASGEQLHSS